MYRAHATTTGQAVQRARTQTQQWRPHGVQNGARQPAGTGHTARKALTSLTSSPSQHRLPTAHTAPTEPHTHGCNPMQRTVFTSPQTKTTRETHLNGYISHVGNVASAARLLHKGGGVGVRKAASHLHVAARAATARTGTATGHAVGNPPAPLGPPQSTPGTAQPATARWGCSTVPRSCGRPIQRAQTRWPGPRWWGPGPVQRVDTTTREHRGHGGAGGQRQGRTYVYMETGMEEAGSSVQRGNYRGAGAREWGGGGGHTTRTTWEMGAVVTAPLGTPGPRTKYGTRTSVSYSCRLSKPMLPHDEHSRPQADATIHTQAHTSTALTRAADTHSVTEPTGDASRGKHGRRGKPAGPRTQTGPDESRGRCTQASQ
jgi:hypothetical protein